MQFSWKNSKAHTRVSIMCALASQTNTASRCLSVYMLRATTAPTLHLWNDSGLERHSIHFCCSVAKLCLAVGNPVDRSTPGFPVHHCFPEFAQIHVHWVGDAVSPSLALLPSSFAFNLSQHQGLFQWIGSLHQVAKILELQQSSQWIFRVDFL